MANFVTVQLLSSGALILLLATAHLSLINVVECQSTIAADDGSSSISADEAAQFHASYEHDFGRISAGNAPSPPLPRVVPTFASAPTTPSAGVPSVMAPPTGGSNSQLRSSRGQAARQHQQQQQQQPQIQATSRIAARPNRLAGRQRTTAPANDDSGSDHYQSVSQAELMAQVNAERRRQAAQQMLGAANAELPASNLDDSADLGQGAASADSAQPLTPTQSQNHLRPSAHQTSMMSSIGSPLSALSAPQPVALAAPVDPPQLQPTYLQRAPASPTLRAPSSSSAATADDQVEPAAASQLQPFASATDANSNNQAAASSANSATDFEPLTAPSFEHVLGHGCPMKGVFSYENKDHCDKYYLCTNGTFTEENCPNGLAYSQMGAVYHHCAYNWNVDCGKKKVSEPIASRGCPWQFGIFPVENNGRCSIEYYVCEWGVPETKRCTPEGLLYDDRIKGCQWADQLGCKSEALLNFKCPPEDEDNPYWPYPRYYHSQRDVIVCVNEQPRLVHCNDDQAVEPSSLACIDIVKKKKKKQF